MFSRVFLVRCVFAEEMAVLWGAARRSRGLGEHAGHLQARLFFPQYQVQGLQGESISILNCNQDCLQRVVWAS